MHLFLLLVMSSALFSNVYCTADIINRFNVGRYPALELRATDPWDFGLAIGNEFRPRIQGFLASDNTLHKTLIPFVESSSGRQAFDTLWQAQNRTFPDYVREVEGIAAGADVDVLQCAIMSVRAELMILINTQADPHCSDLHVGGSIFAHNEDGSIHALNTSFFIHAHTQYPDSKPSEWVSFVYPGQTAGAAFGVNIGSGVGVSLNAVFPRDASLSLPARYLLGRALLDADSVATALHVIQNPGVASGESINIGCAGTASQNIEIRGASPNISIATTTTFQWHFNMYDRVNVPQFSDASSEHRRARANTLSQPVTAADVLRELGDTGDVQYPIYRTGLPPDTGVATLATGLFNFDIGELQIFDANPANSKPVWTVAFGNNKGFPEWAVIVICVVGGVVGAALIFAGFKWRRRSTYEAV